MAALRPGPNLSKIASVLGVSTATVSNALSGKGRVSTELAERIRRVVDDLGYVPSLSARALRTGRTGVLGLVLPDIANPLFPQIAQAIEFAASTAGYGVLIADSRGNVAMQTEAIDRLLERDVDGMVIIPRRGTRINDIGCPVVVIDTPSTPGNTVSADHWQGGQLVTRHLSDLGHKRVLILGGSPTSNVQNDRVGGMKSALGPGITTKTVWIEQLEAKLGPGCPLGLADEIGNGVTAIAALSDLHALRALTELQRAGIRVPEQASITGFDDLVWASVVTPALTTVRMDTATIADIAISALVGAVETRVSAGRSHPMTASGHATVAAQIQSVPMDLIIRQSTGPAPHHQRIRPEGEPAP